MPAAGCEAATGVGIIPLGLVGRAFAWAVTYRPASGRVPERPKGAVCKTAGFAYTGSNPVPATTFELRNYTTVTRLRRGPFYQRSTSFYHPTRPALLMGRTDPQSAWPGGVGSAGAGGCRFYSPTCRRRHGVTARRSRWRAPWPPPSPTPASGAAGGDARRPRRLARRPGTPGWHAPAEPGCRARSAAPGRAQPAEGPRRAGPAAAAAALADLAPAGRRAVPRPRSWAGSRLPGWRGS